MAGKPKVCFNDGTVVEQTTIVLFHLTFRYVTKWFTKCNNYAILIRDNRLIVSNAHVLPSPRPTPVRQ